MLSLCTVLGEVVQPLVRQALLLMAGAFLLLVTGMMAPARLVAARVDTDLPKQLRDLDGRVIVLGTVRQPPLAGMLARDVEARLRAANRADRRAWETVKTRADWEQFREQRLQALRASLGDFPPVPTDLKVRRTGSLEGDGYRVDNLVFQSRPGLLVTANLYRPAQPAPSLPGLILCHSHFQGKSSGVRQDMAMTWARAGCLVLVPDHLGHGERRQHPFGAEGLHDYHFRYDIGIQLHLAGESLMGWMAWDLMRGVDLLLAQKGIDPKRIVVVSDPAGGGDVAAVTAALDPRITGVMVQNFGGPQPETPYPLPRDAEESFAYAGSGSWESTRNLRLSARDGFLPWMIVASAAPRRLIYDHEFYWDREQDPVWKRLQRVYGFFNATEALAGVSGRGFVVGSAPENSHWLPMNRELLYPILERWFAIPNPKKEFSKRRPAEELLCLTPAASQELKPQELHVLAAQLGTERGTASRKGRPRLGQSEQRNRLRQDWARLLGDVVPKAEPVMKGLPLDSQQLGRVTVERLHLGTEPGIVVPVLLLLPSRPKREQPPVVVGVAQQGKQEFLRQRAEPIAELLEAGIAVCLPDLRGTGETSPGDSRDRRSAATSLSSSELMLGQSLLGGRVRDLRSVLLHLRKRGDLDGKRVALWGDSFAKVNPRDTNFQVPHTAGDRPPQSEPLGGLLALLGALFEDDVRAVYVHRGLGDFRSVLEGPFCYLPHDVAVPGALTIGDLCDVAVALTPRPVRLDGMVDGLNRVVSEEELGRRYEPARAAYGANSARDRLQLGGRLPVARWLIAELGGQ
jgi:dienelactone hydrolase